MVIKTVSCHCDVREFVLLTAHRVAGQSFVNKVDVLHVRLTELHA